MSSTPKDMMQQSKHWTCKKFLPRILTFKNMHQNIKGGFRVLDYMA